MVWTAKDGMAHLFEKAEEGQKSVCGRAIVKETKVWSGVSPTTPPCLLCAQFLAKQSMQSPTPSSGD